MLKTVRRKEASLLAAIAAVGLAVSPAIASSALNGKKRPPAVKVSFDDGATFTPANADPKLAASLAGRGLSLTDFKFTPAAPKGRPKQLRVAIRVRTDAPGAAIAATAPTVNSLDPTSYNLGVAVGWRRFAVAGDVAKADSLNPALGGRESAVVGVSYNLKRFTGRLAVGAERDDNKAAPSLPKGDKYSLDLGGSYNLSRRVALTGGVRYNVEKERLNALNDERRDSQAVYIGTAIKF